MSGAGIVGATNFESEIIKIAEECRPRDRHKQIYVLPSIPLAKLRNAEKSCGIPEGERVLALVDFTVWGSAKDCLIIGSSGIFWRNFQKQGSLAYESFPDYSFSETTVCLGNLQPNLIKDMLLKIQEFIRTL